MEELLKSIQDLIGHAQKLCKGLQEATLAATDIVKVSEKKIGEANDQLAALNAKDINLSEREDKVSRIEDIVNLTDEGRALAKQNKEALLKLESDQSAFNKKRADDLKDITQQAARIADDNVLLNRGWEDLHKAEAKLREDTANMREKVIRDLKALK